MHRYAVAILFVVVGAQATEFMDCDGIHPAGDLRVDGCNNLPCEFPRGQDIVAEMDFDAETQTSKLKPLVRVKALGMWVEYPIGYDDACDYLTAGSCPLYPGDRVTYKIKIPVLQAYPKISILVEVTLKNQDDQPVSCFQITGKVVD